MTHRAAVRSRRTLVAGVVAILSAAGSVEAQVSNTIGISTNEAWHASFSNGTTTFSGPAGQWDCTIPLKCISISDNGSRVGSIVGGGTAFDFQGTWKGWYSFFLPANATNLLLSYTVPGVDDRGTLRLNGTDLASFYLGGSFPTNAVFSTSSAFILGGMNTLTIDVINNPFDPRNGAPRTWLDDFDGTAFLMSGDVTFDTPSAVVPEPATLGLTMAGVGVLALVARRRSRKLANGETSQYSSARRSAVGKKVPIS